VRLKKEIAQYRSTQLLNAEKAREYDNLVPLMHFERGPFFPAGYRAVNARVISSSFGPFSHELEIAAGSSSGIGMYEPVVSGDGLVGRVTNVSSDTAVVSLLSDTGIVVAARDLKTGVQGLVRTGPGGTLILDEVLKQDVVHAGDVLVTAGTRDPRYPDLDPYGIPIGRVTYANATDTANFLQVQLAPYANLGSLDSVAVLVKTQKHK
jgi:rod shape-determining protein MreC